MATSPAPATASRLVVALAVAAAALVLWVLVRHGTSIPASADDYCNRLNALHGTLAEATAKSYVDWTGRLLTTVVLYATFRAVDLPHAWIASVAMPFLLALACGLFAAALCRERDATRVVLAAFLFCLLPLGLYPLTGQALFWPTGGIVYMVPLVVLAAWLAMLDRIAAGRPVPGGVLLPFALGVLAGNAIELLWGPLLLVGGVAFARARGPQARRAVGATLAGIAAGMLVLGAAPGNFHRAGVTPRSFSTDVGWLAGEYVRMAAEVFASGWLLMALAVALVAASVLVRRTSVPGSALPALLVASAFASLVPVLAAPPQFAPRNGLFLLVLLFGAAVAFAWPRVARTRTGMAMLAVAALCAALVLAVRFHEDTQIAQVLHHRWQQRDAQLRSAVASGQRDVELPRLTVYPSPSIHSLELGDDPQRWDNKCVAQYYGLDAIRVPPPR